MPPHTSLRWLGNNPQSALLSATFHGGELVVDYTKLAADESRNIACGLVEGAIGMTCAQSEIVHAYGEWSTKDRRTAAFTAFGVYGRMSSPLTRGIARATTAALGTGFLRFKTPVAPSYELETVTTECFDQYGPFLINGWSDEAIAAATRKSKNTVKGDLWRVRKQLGVTSTAALALYCHGLADYEPPTLPALIPSDLSEVPATIQAAVHLSGLDVARSALHGS